MRWAIASLMIFCATSAAEAERVRFCFLFCTVETEAPADSFCAAYERVIRSELDGAEIGTVSRAVRQRIARNDALYRCVCQNWQHPVCRDLAR